MPRSFFQLCLMMETADNQFLTALVNAKGDKLPWLVYADWLDENGNAELAEAIRLALDPTARQKLPHLNALLEKEQNRLTGLGYRFESGRLTGPITARAHRVMPPSGSEPAVGEGESLELHPDGVYSFPASRRSGFSKLPPTQIVKSETIDALAVSYLRHLHQDAHGNALGYQGEYDHERQVDRLGSESLRRRSVALPIMSRDVFHRQLGDHLRDLEAAAAGGRNVPVQFLVRAWEASGGDRWEDTPHEEQAATIRQRVEQLTAARGVITRTTAEYEALTREFEQRLAERDAQESALRASLGAELELLQRALSEQPVVEQLRDEVRELSSQLDDERLKSMALQRALERFAAMGGTIPKQAEGDASTRS